MGTWQTGSHPVDFGLLPVVLADARSFAAFGPLHWLVHKTSGGVWVHRSSHFATTPRPLEVTDGPWPLVTSQAMTPSTVTAREERSSSKGVLQRSSATTARAGRIVQRCDSMENPDRLVKDKVPAPRHHARYPRKPGHWPTPDHLATGPNRTRHWWPVVTYPSGSTDGIWVLPDLVGLVPAGGARGPRR